MKISQFIDRLVKQYKYKALPPELSQMARQRYEASLPKLDRSKPIFSKDGVKIAENFERICIGDYGAYIEFSENQAVSKNFSVKKGEEYRLQKPYINRVKYIWLTAGNSGCKIYKQLRVVSYADYKPNMFYISPDEIQQ